MMTRTAATGHYTRLKGQTGCAPDEAPLVALLWQFHVQSQYEDTHPHEPTDAEKAMTPDSVRPPAAVRLPALATQGRGR